MLEKRNLDGVYFRIQRNGKWDNVCFTDLIEPERISIMENRDIDWVKSLCLILAHKLRQIGDQFDLVARMEDDE